VFGFGKKKLAEVTVPGEGTATLPAGKVEIRYVEDREGRSVGTDGGTSWAGPGKDLAVTVTPAGGGNALPIVPPRMISEGSGRTIYKQIGKVELSADTECVISASMTVTDDHFAPRIVARA
jgi:hypothetical protein